MCLALGIDYRLSVMGTPTCCPFMWPGLPNNMEVLRVPSQERDPGEDSNPFTHHHQTSFTVTSTLHYSRQQLQMSPRFKERGQRLHFLLRRDKVLEEQSELEIL